MKLKKYYPLSFSEHKTVLNVNATHILIEHNKIHVVLYKVGT